MRLISSLKQARLKMTERLNSFQTRLFFSSFLMVLVLLPTLGVIINSAFSTQMQKSIQNELKAFSYSILAVTEVEQQQLLLPEVFLENQFNVSESGLYAAFSHAQVSKQLTDLPSTDIDENLLAQQHLVWTSPSLLGLQLTSQLPKPELGQTVFQNIVLDNRQHFIFSFTVSFSEDESTLPVTLHILKDQTDFMQSITHFKHQLWLWLILLMFILLAIQAAWLLYTLRPLNTISKEIKAVESGAKQQVESNYPLELQQLADQLNTLLRTEHQQRQRYRNALSDLAHSLKTPLAVIQSQEDLSANSQQQVIRINNTIEHQLKRAQSAGQSAWHVGIKIKPIVTKLLSSLNKIYHDKQLQLSSDIEEHVVFRGDESDLFELLGNLLDNACKAAKHRVHVIVQSDENNVSILVADDGVGVLPEQQDIILTRGTRADTYEQGHGIGLAIVRDLIESYQGNIHIKTSQEFGGALFVLNLPK